MKGTIPVAQECVRSFIDFKTNRSYSYLIFKYSHEQKSIAVYKAAPPNETYEDFLHALPDGDCCYAVVNLDYQTRDLETRSNIVFFSWYAWPSV